MKAIKKITASDFFEVAMTQQLKEFLNIEDDGNEWKRIEAIAVHMRYQIIFAIQVQL